LQSVQSKNTRIYPLKPTR